VLLAIAIACYVAAEVGVSSWTVRFLVDVPLETATLALSGFWAGLALGRVVTAAWGDRYSHSLLAAGSSVIAGVAVILAVATAPSPLAIAAIAVAGFASGPIFPLILTIGSELNRERAAAVAGTLTAAAVAGGVIYPPLVGLVSESIGLGAGLLGAAVLSFLAAVAIFAAVRVEVGSAALRHP
jgi:fucose permease